MSVVLISFYLKTCNCTIEICLAQFDWNDTIDNLQRAYFYQSPFIHDGRVYTNVTKPEPMCSLIVPQLVRNHAWLVLTLGSMGTNISEASILVQVVSTFDTLVLKCHTINIQCHLLFGNHTMLNLFTIYLVFTNKKTVEP